MTPYGSPPISLELRSGKDKRMLPESRETAPEAVSAGSLRGARAFGRDPRPPSRSPFNLTELSYA